MHLHHQIALLSITACSHGLNLTQAGTVVFAELYWVPGTIIQAEDRAHRMGTEYSTIDIHYLIGEVRELDLAKTLRDATTICKRTNTPYCWLLLNALPLF